MTTTSTTLTIGRLRDDIAEDFRGYLAEGHSEDHVRQWIDAQAITYTPSATTVLFQLVVDDNSLAFVETDGEHDYPFDSLHAAVAEVLTAHLIAIWEAGRDDDTIGVPYCPALPNGGARCGLCDREFPPGPAKDDESHALHPDLYAHLRDDHGVRTDG